MTLVFLWNSNSLRDDDRATVQANLMAEIPNACEYFDLESEPKTVTLSVIGGNNVVEGVVRNSAGREIVLVKYHLDNNHTAMYRTPGQEHSGDDSGRQ